MAAVMTRRSEELRALIRRHKRWDAAFAVVGILSLMVGVLTLAALFANMLIDGLPRLSSEFFTSFPSRRAGQAGIARPIDAGLKPRPKARAARKPARSRGR